MRTLITLLAFVPAIANAETFTIETKVTEATVYPQGAEIIRTGAFSIPAGNHRLILKGVPSGDVGTQFSTLQVLAEGLSQTALIRRAENVPLLEYKSEAVRQAEDQVKAVEDQIRTAEDEADSTRLGAEAARQTLSFLDNLGHNEGLAGASAGELRDFARMIGEESLRAGTIAQTAEIEARKIEERLEHLEKDLAVAQANLDALIPEVAERLFVAVDVTAEAAIDGNLTLSYFDPYAGEWAAGYEFHLTTGDTPEVRIDRSILITQETGENWRDITVNVSTIEPTGQNAASRLRPRLRSIHQIPENFSNLEEPVIEAPVVMEETQGGLPMTASVEGTGVTYTVPQKISVSTGLEFAEIKLDSISQAADVFALAMPLRDDTAYRTARFENPLDQSLMASGLAKWFVDGVLVAAGESSEIRPSEEVVMGFGPIYGLSVSRLVSNRSSGDTGLITRSNQRVEKAEIHIENLTEHSWPLRVIDRMPYSEQDDLEITWTAQPRPTEENVDSKRGILAWEMEMAPGQTDTIQLDLKLSWPEGMVLD